ncbi:MAG: transcriptional repressor [Synergistaceae bacterium]|nr:transcriptional repressor [Synergistaceae bacterium]
MKGSTLQKLLRERGMRATLLRREVLKLLLSREKEPLSHTEIFELLTARPGYAPDRVTLYRILAAFSDAKIVHQVQGTDGTVRFCLHEPFQPGCPGNHPHFLCRLCGRMICLADQMLPHVDVPEGTTVEGKQMLLFGVCPACREREN